jgi:hypothetical protein
MSLNQKPHIDGLFTRWMVNFSDMGDHSQQFGKFRRVLKKISGIEKKFSIIISG